MEQTIQASRLIPFPEKKKAEVDRLLKAEIAQNKQKIVVLDDDPTGVQTVHDLSVYTDWTVESLRQGFAEENKMFFILTNSRGMTASETTAAHREIVKNTAQVSRETGIDCFLISRSDSTLRGHFPLETQLIREGMETENGIRMDGEVLCALVDILVDAVCSKRKTIRIAGDDKPINVVKSQFMKLNSSHVEYVMDSLKSNTTKVRNIKQYILATLYNAPLTMSSYYQAEVLHNFPQFAKKN